MKTILLAEDKLSYQQAVHEALERAGYSVIAVDNGSEAMDLLDVHEFDLVLTDYCMPGPQGDEVAKKARSKGITKIIINSAMADKLEPIPGVLICSKMTVEETVDRVRSTFEA